jgi:serine phosphatase RsbU (regulator of sigma subunit)
LSRRIVFWVFVSVIVIEAIILIPSYRNRQRELLGQLEALSRAKVDVITALTPEGCSDDVLMDYLQILSRYPIIVGATVYDNQGRVVGQFGEAPTLTYGDVHTDNRTALLDVDGLRYDVWTDAGTMPNEYSLIIRHDAVPVKDELNDFILRIAGLVLIISIFVTAGAWIALEPIVVTPILRLRSDLEKAGEAIVHDRSTPDFYSASVRRHDELGEVIEAFNQMYRQVSEAISQRKRAEQALQKSLAQVEAFSLAMRKELDKGRRMQMNFLPPDLPKASGWRIGAYFKPARQVAGDFYDAFELPDGKIALVVADVCDKGVGAALFMGLFRSLLRVFSGQGEMGCVIRNPTGVEPALRPVGQDPMMAVQLTNNYVAANHEDLTMFATLFFAVLDPVSGELTYINGGQEPIYLVSAEGGIRMSLGPTGPAVGVQQDVDFRVAACRMAPGEILLAYTDGVTEAAHNGGELFSTERLIALLAQPARTAEELVERVGTAVLAHTGDAEQFDDITLLAVQRCPVSPSER